MCIKLDKLNVSKNYLNKNIFNNRRIENYRTEVILQFNRKNSEY